MNPMTPLPASEAPATRLARSGHRTCAQSGIGAFGTCRTIKRVALWALASLVLSPVPAYPGEPVTSGAERASPATVSAGDALSILGLDDGQNAADSAFLHPDDAFVFNIGFVQTNTIVARWTMADTYYLYRDKFHIALNGSARASLGAVVFPPGTIKNDPYFGEVEVFYQSAQATFTVQGVTAGTKEIVFDVTYQGCTDLGLCYPPITKTVALANPTASSRLSRPSSP